MKVNRFTVFSTTISQMRFFSRLGLLAALVILPIFLCETSVNAGDTLTTTGYLIELSGGSHGGSFHLTSPDFTEGFDMGLDYSRTTFDGMKMRDGGIVSNGRFVRVMYIPDPVNKGYLTALRITTVGTKHLSFVN